MATLPENKEHLAFGLIERSLTNISHKTNNTVCMRHWGGRKTTSLHTSLHLEFCAIYHSFLVLINNFSKVYWLDGWNELNENLLLQNLSLKKCAKVA